MHSFILCILFFCFPGEILNQTSNSNRTSTPTEHHKRHRDKLYIFISDTAQNAPQTEQRQLYILTFLIYHRRTTRHEKHNTSTQQYNYYLIFYAVYTPPQTATEAPERKYYKLSQILPRTPPATAESTTHGLYYNLSGYTSKPCIIHCRRIETA